MTKEFTGNKILLPKTAQQYNKDLKFKANGLSPTLMGDRER